MYIQIVEWAHTTNGGIASHRLKLSGAFCVEFSCELTRSELELLQRDVEDALQDYERKGEYHYHGQSMPRFGQNEETKEWYCKGCGENITDKEILMKVRRDK